MERRTIARALRAIRRRKRLSQCKLAQRIGISQSELSRREQHALAGCSIEELERWADALNARLLVELRVDGEKPMTDARHATLQDWLAGLLRANGWIVLVEPSFKHYGDRGRMDVLAYHPTRRVLLVVEIKTRVDDSQEPVGRLDVKRRIAPVLAREQGWQADAVVPMVLLDDQRTNRRRIAQHAELFASHSLRGRSAVAWLRRPTASAPNGILVFAAPR